MTSCRIIFVVKLNEGEKDDNDTEYIKENKSDSRKGNMDWWRLRYYANCVKRILEYKNYNQICLETWDVVSSVAFGCSVLVFLVGYIILVTTRLNSDIGQFKHWI